MRAFVYTPDALRDILISCTLSILLNYSSFAIVGKLSPLAFAVVGNLKTGAVFVFGYILFDAIVTLKNIVGVTISIVGIALYSYLKIIEAAQA